MEEEIWTTQGISQQIDANRLKDQLKEKYDFAIKSHTHLWQAIAMYSISDNALKNLNKEALHLDVENMMGLPMIGCFVCEQPFNSKMIYGRCPGEPKT